MSSLFSKASFETIKNYCSNPKAILTAVAFFPSFFNKAREASSNLTSVLLNKVLSSRASP
jgi:threonine/homoserine/homoserine lactone efflux protein